MAVLSLSIEFGAQPREFPSEIARLLGARLVDLAALERHLGECCGDLGNEWNAAKRQQYASVFQEDAVRRHSDLVLAEAAVGNVVIHSYFGSFLLQSTDHVSTILVRGSPVRRATITQHEFAYPSIAVARLEIEHADAAISRLILGNFGADWKDPTFYDLVIESDDLDRISAIRRIINAASRGVSAKPGVSSACRPVAPRKQCRSDRIHFRNF